MMKPNEITPHLFRTEYSKIVAVLCKNFNIQNIEIAEDIASETFLKASEHWAVRGLPENPAAWLYTVAKNKAKDHFKHLAVFETAVKKAIQTGETSSSPSWDFDTKSIADSQLEMIFTVCNPVNTRKAQICLALQILCGFSVEEIANAFLSKPETIKKRLQRAREVLRTSNFNIMSLSEQDIQSRQEAVLTTLYLLFNEGYFSKTNDLLIRKDLCSEAIRLTLVLTDNPMTNTPQSNALLALMCFQSSRLEARTDREGKVILLDEQDSAFWDKALIERGNYYLIQACGNGYSEISKYHIEAAIAYWHTAPPNEHKWQHILELYNQLVHIESSPATALNRAFALSKVYGKEKAIGEVENTGFEKDEYYHGLLGYLYAGIDVDKAVWHYSQAVTLTKSASEKRVLSNQIVLLSQRKKEVSH